MLIDRRCVEPLKFSIKYTSSSLKILEMDASPPFLWRISWCVK